ncbi:fumarylacetoacetate hydrolase family protein [Marivibrio halodurans]|uniref:Fumarylacetoacetate hydrolase family protein n=1 Tax=Marivibrio halodurans TaxID=2039722 RepID=A0A8J7S3Y9_9PROT|nr:fumarylacetoacetate hydrolase family protein [Marivibrio halodurans]MBP5858284.1 fumarylacetoacetate hydrolase family protein [Marivibrio halodurans]
MDFILPAPPQASVAVAGEAARFPVRRIFCVGRNYAAHAREMGKDPDREPPFFFTKPADAVVDTGATIPYPPETENLHHEIELVVAIGAEGRAVPKEKARDLIWGYGVGIDLTRRDLQTRAKEMGRPWDWGKAFDNSAPCAPLVRRAEAGAIDDARIWLAVDGERRQDASVEELIWDIPEIVSIVSHTMVLRPGDLIYTGTPAGVGAVTPGQRMTGGVGDLPEIDITIGPRG